MILADDHGADEVFKISMNWDMSWVPVRNLHVMSREGHLTCVVPQGLVTPIES